MRGPAALQSRRERPRSRHVHKDASGAFAAPLCTVPWHWHRSSNSESAVRRADSFMRARRSLPLGMRRHANWQSQP
jgi:hypothetical protein